MPDKVNIEDLCNDQLRTRCQFDKRYVILPTKELISVQGYLHNNGTVFGTPLYVPTDNCQNIEEIFGFQLKTVKFSGIDYFRFDTIEKELNPNDFDEIKKEFFHAYFDVSKPIFAEHMLVVPNNDSNTIRSKKLGSYNTEPEKASRINRILSNNLGIRDTAIRVIGSHMLVNYFTHNNILDFNNPVNDLDLMIIGQEYLSDIITFLESNGRFMKGKIYTNAWEDTAGRIIAQPEASESGAFCIALHSRENSKPVKLDFHFGYHKSDTVELPAKGIEYRDTIADLPVKIKRSNKRIVKSSLFVPAIYPLDPGDHGCKKLIIYSGAGRNIAQHGDKILVTNAYKVEIQEAKRSYDALLITHLHPTNCRAVDQSFARGR